MAGMTAPTDRKLAATLAAGFASSLRAVADDVLEIRVSGTEVELVGWARIDFAAVDREGSRDERAAGTLHWAMESAQDVLMHATGEPWPWRGDQRPPAVHGGPAAHVRVDRGEVARLWFAGEGGPVVELPPVSLRAPGSRR
jgi:hypothetical protein